MFVYFMVAFAIVADFLFELRREICRKALSTFPSHLCEAKLEGCVLKAASEVGCIEHKFIVETSRTRSWSCLQSGGEAICKLRLPQGNTTFVHWTPDGTGLDYFLTNKGVGNIWRQPVPKGLPRQVTNFTSGQIFSFDWSSDGKRLYVARGSISSDIVLITKLSLNRQ